MAKRPRHPNKEIEAAVAFAETHDWRWKKGKGHCWGRLLCPYEDRDGCRISVWSTPKSPANHARDIKALVNKCECEEGNDD